jgi:hypothetical protein
MKFLFVKERLDAMDNRPVKALKITQVTTLQDVYRLFAHATNPLEATKA